MNIDPTRLSHVSKPGIDKAAQTSATPAATGAQAAGATPAPDGLALSQQAAEVRAAHEALAAVPDVRTDLVARLKAQVAAGAYQPNPQNIAEKMIP